MLMKFIVFFDTVDLSMYNVLRGIYTINIIIVIDLKKGPNKSTLAVHGKTNRKWILSLRQHFAMSSSGGRV